MKRKETDFIRRRNILYFEILVMNYGGGLFEHPKFVPSRGTDFLKLPISLCRTCFLPFPTSILKNHRPNFSKTRSNSCPHSVIRIKSCEERTKILEFVACPIQRWLLNRNVPWDVVYYTVDCTCMFFSFFFPQSMSFRSYFYLTQLIWLPSLVYICIIKHNEFWIVRITRDKKIIGEGIWKMFFLGNEMKDGVLATEMKKSLDQWWGHTLNELPFFFFFLIVCPISHGVDS